LTVCHRCEFRHSDQ